MQKLICGIDEAGRGTLCGSLFVAGVACSPETATLLKNQGIKDSKTLTKDARATLSTLIQNTPKLFFTIIEKTAAQIDSKGLSLCLKESILSIIESLSPHAQDFYLDGNTTFHLRPTPPITLSCLIKGDSLMPQISAASILAKHAKDQEMTRLHSLYPDYDFINHAGYGTKAHLEKLASLGLTPHHRRSFKLKPPRSLF